MEERNTQKKYRQVYLAKSLIGAMMARINIESQSKY
jgi:hypothetical protein